ncbi:MAG TPA: RNA polymerase sigma factor [Pyrinomonadaceae bacterium]|nr:RNA polymerase sigma factor [Pyrinomonadaceae bacterium]
MPDQTTDDAALLGAAVRGDEAAFAALYARHAAAIYRFAARLLGDATVAEDVTHDCFLGLIKNPANFQAARSPLRTYLYGAARNLAHKRFRAQNQETCLDDLTDAGEELIDRGLGASPLRELLDDELARAVQQAVAALPPLQREALVLFEYEELTLAEIAVITGAEVGSVKARLHRARRRLRESLRLYLDGTGVVANLSEEHEHA